MKFKIDLRQDCDHTLCDCIKDAIQGKVLPAVYDEGYADGAADIIAAIPDILNSASEAIERGISPREWGKQMSRDLVEATRSRLAQDSGHKANVTIDGLVN